MTEAVLYAIVIIGAVLVIVWLERAGDPPSMAIDAAYGVQCKPPLLDYSHRPVRLDSEGIA